MNLFPNGFSLELALEMLKRRLWLATALLSVIVTVAGSLAIFLPSIYTATAVILVEGQQVPQDYVRSTVTMSLERRLQILSQEILSRARLAELAKQFDLYPGLRAAGAPEDTIATAMRRDIGIQIKGRGSGISSDTVVLEITYSSSAPQKNMQVANTLASFYIQGNLKVREQQAVGTTEFLRTELETVKKRLEEQEQKVVAYKMQNMGDLPEQLNANLSTLSVLQKQMEILSDNLNRARERRNVLIQMAEMDSALTSLEAGTSQSSGDTRINGLIGQLAELKMRFSDKHPDVIRIKQQIATLEEQAKLQAQSSPSSENLEGALPAPRMSSAQIEQTTVDAEIKTLSASLQKVQHDLAVYQQRIENAPKREQELTGITRDYTITRDLYSSLLKRLDEAKLSGNLEEEQKAERFRLLEPAVLPQQPSGPKREMLLLMGLVLGLGAAVASVLVRELLDPSIHSTEELKAFTKVNVFGVIPQIATESDSAQLRWRRSVGAVALFCVLLFLIQGSYRISVGNENLVRYIVRPPAGILVR